MTGSGVSSWSWCKVGKVSPPRGLVIDNRALPKDRWREECANAREGQHRGAGVSLGLRIGGVGLRSSREGKKHHCVVASHVAPIGDLARNPGMCPDWELNQRPFDSQPTLNPLGHTSQGSPEDVKSSCHLCRASP